MKRKPDVLIWTKDQVWLQTYADDGAIRLSGCGKVSLASCKGFCRDRGIELHEMQGDLEVKVD